MAFGSRVPLGVNMAFRRDAFTRAGLLDPKTGRKAGTLLGQEVREWCIRARAANVRGMYIPDMAVRHVIPASRLNKKYFRRWFYWRGVSRALLYAQYGLDMEKPEDPALDPRIVPQVLGVPRHLFRKALAHLIAAARTMLRGDVVAAFEHELWLCFFAGIVRRRALDLPPCQPCAAAEPRQRPFHRLIMKERSASAPDDVDRAPDRSRSSRLLTRRVHDVLFEARTPVYLGGARSYCTRNQLSARADVRRLVYQRVSGTNSLRSSPPGRISQVIGVAAWGHFRPCTSNADPG